MGKTAIVTGAGRNIGRAIALKLAKDGMDVVVNDIMADNVEKVAKEIEALGVSSMAVAGDVTQEKDVQALVDATVKKFGKLDVMVANAGIAVTKSWDDTKVEDMDRLYAVNIKGVFLCATIAARQMKKQPDDAIYKIINCGSIASHKGFSYLGGYCCTKAAVRSLTQSLAQEVAPKITVNAYCPGVVDTDMWVAIDKDLSPYLGMETGGAWKTFTSGILMGRPQYPDDVADLVSFLASPAADYITGQSIITDGGMIFA
ncbi:MAG: glucose 1-dehydrogenase [Bacillota bacterium]